MSTLRSVAVLAGRLLALGLPHAVAVWRRWAAARARRTERHIEAGPPVARVEQPATDAGPLSMELELVDGTAVHFSATQRRSGLGRPSWVVIVNAHAGSHRVSHSAPDRLPEPRAEASHAEPWLLGHISTRAAR